MPDASFPWSAFIMFAFTNSMSPGPNIIMLAGSGSAWGFWRSVPHLAGVCLGFPFMVLVVQYGAHEAFTRFPWIFPVLIVASLIYVIWLSCKIAALGFAKERQIFVAPRPMNFFEAVLFQWMNGKGWQLVIMIATLFPTHSSTTKNMIALTFVGTLIFCGSFWVELGKRISAYLQKPRFRRIYYSFLAASLLLSTVPTGIFQLMTIFKMR